MKKCEVISAECNASFDLFCTPHPLPAPPPSEGEGWVGGRTPHFFDERGLALAVVLWILAFLGVVFTAFTFSMRTELAAAGNFREQAEAYNLAEAGVYRAAAEIINADRNAPPDSTAYDALNERWHTNPAVYDNVPLGRGHYQVTVTDEESKVPLNAATDPILRRLFSNAGVRDDKLLSTIVDSVQDWRDPDNLHHLNGAEDDYYLSLPTSYRAKNANFESIEELLLVKGMIPEFLYGNVTNPQRRTELEGQLPWERQLRSGEYLGVARHLSVFSSGKVNINTASPEVLMALGLTAGETKLALAWRAVKPFGGVENLTSSLVSTLGTLRGGFEVVQGDQSGAEPIGSALTKLQQIGTARSQTFYVESTGRLAGSRIVSRVGAVLQNVGSSGRPKLSMRLWSLDPRQGA